MSLDEAVKQQFTDSHQPSLAARARHGTKPAKAKLAQDVMVMSSEGSELCPVKLMRPPLVRGVVTCADCMRPRCLYSQRAPQLMKPAELDGAKLAAKPVAARGKAKTASPVQEPTPIELCRAYAVEQLYVIVAQENEHFLCGMQPFDSDHPLHGVIIARDSLECHGPNDI